MRKKISSEKLECKETEKEGMKVRAKEISRRCEILSASVGMIRNSCISDHGSEKEADGGQKVQMQGKVMLHSVLKHLEVLGKVLF